MRRLWMFPAILAILVACTGSSTDTDTGIPLITGTWEGVGAGLVFDLELEEHEETREVTGHGEARVIGPGIVVSVTGRHTHPEVELNITATGLNVSYAGILQSHDLIVGRGTEANLPEYQLDLVRQ